jgi:hypothetical protein
MRSLPSVALVPSSNRNVQFRSKVVNGMGRNVPLPLIWNIGEEPRYQRRKTAEEVSSCALIQFFVTVCRVRLSLSCFLLKGQWAGNFVGKQMVRNMSKRSHQSDLQEIRGWTTEHVQKVLRDVSCAQSVLTWHLLLLCARAFPWPYGQSTEVELCHPWRHARRFGKRKAG